MKMDTSKNIVATQEKGLPLWRIAVFGLGNFASQLSWNMVSTYLSIFYTDAVGLSASAVATLFLIARIWDAINDPMMGQIAERTKSRWGRFRPYIIFGAPILAITIILTFRNPGLGTVGNLIYAYITYICLTMAYTVVNVPYGALPYAITTNRKDVPALGAANMIGMNLGMILLNLITLKLVFYFGKGNNSKGYANTATLYAIIAMFLFWVVAAGTKEVVKVKKERIPVSKSLKLMFKNRNIDTLMIYNILSSLAIMGRIGTMVYYYMYVINRPDLVGLFMTLPTVVGTIASLPSSWFIRKVGTKRAMYISNILNILAFIILYMASGSRLWMVILGNVIYGIGYIGAPAMQLMLRDSVDRTELETGCRIDGTVAGFNGLISKISNAVGASIALYMIGAAGYVGGQEVTPKIAEGINKAANILPLICVLLSFIPLFLVKISDKDSEILQQMLNEKRRQKESN